MHFLHIIQRYYPYTGGSELYFQEFSEQLAADGHQVTVLTTNAWDLDHFWAAGRKTVDEAEARHNGVRIKRFPVERSPGPPIVYPILRRLMVELGRLPGTTPLLRRMALLTPRVPQLQRYLATTGEHFDLVHTTNITLDFTILPALRFAQQRGIPHLCTPFVHLGEPGKRQIVRYYTQPHQIEILRRSQRVMVQTTLEGDELRQLGVPDEQLRLIGCWVRPETLEGGSAERFRREHNLHGPIVLSIGAAAYDKGTMHTIEAMQRLWQSGSDATLVLIAGTTLAQFEQFYATLPESTRQRILLIRAAPHQTKLDALAAADVYVMPSRTDSFGIVYLEAWIYDVPVIGARAGGVPAVIDHGHDGLLVEFGDVAALADEIQRLLSDRDLARRLGQAGHAKVLRQLLFEQQYAKIRAVYQEVTGREL
ncbi:MAG: glycosyltransferase family 4 protein [Chloroflexi bacterium]|nr:glycosyltransferase family 4 protein [Chloroflexota bacterium]